MTGKDILMVFGLYLLLRQPRSERDVDEGIEEFEGLYGPVRECVEYGKNVQGRRYCKKWTTNYKCSRIAPKMPVCELNRPCLGKQHRYAHPSVPEGVKNDYLAYYKLVEADDLITSHDPTRNFIHDSRYPEGVQDRDYQNPRGQDQLAVIKNAQTLDPDRVVNLSLTSAEGPPIVTPDNIVLSGNSRAMSIRLASVNQSARYDRYVDKLERDAATYGFTEADIDLFEAPVLVRQVELTDDEIPAFASFANKPVSRTLDPIGKSIELAKLIPDAALQRMELEAGETLRSFLETGRGKVFVDILIRLTSPTERGQLFSETGKLTEAGKSIIEDALFAKVFDRRDLIANMSEQVKRALEYSLPALLQAQIMADNGQILPEWDISEAMRQAVDFVNRNLRGVSLTQFLRQLDFVGKDAIDFNQLSGQAIRLIAAVGTKPRILKEKIERFIAEAEFESAPKLIPAAKRSPAQVLSKIIESSKEEEAAGQTQLVGASPFPIYIKTRKTRKKGAKK